MAVGLERAHELGDGFGAREQLGLPVGQKEQALFPSVDVLKHAKHRARLDLLVPLLGELVILEHGRTVNAIFLQLLVEQRRRHETGIV